MSATYQASGDNALKTKPTAWCCVKALLVVGAGAAFWTAAFIIMMRASGS